MPQLTDIGRLGRDVEVRYTPSGDAVASLALACEYGRKGQDGKRPTQWVDATLWGKQAEAMAPHLQKGQLLFFSIDDAHIETYKKNDGSEGFKLVGRISSIKFAGSAPEQSQQQQQQAPRQQQRPAPQQQRQQAAQSFDDDIDMSIPF